MTAAKTKFLLWSVPLIILAAGVGAFMFFSAEDRNAFEIAASFYRQNHSLIENKNYLAIIDYTKPSWVKRLFIYDAAGNRVRSFLVAHGKESGFIFAREFSNESNSHKSCKGFFLTGEPFIGENGLSLLLHGLQEGINNNALARDIVIHGASYVSWGSLLENCGRLGRSLGCPAVSQEDIDEVVGRLKNGALIYIHAP
jgi:hypothetical protein